MFEKTVKISFVLQPFTDLIYYKSLYQHLNLLLALAITNRFQLFLSTTADVYIHLLHFSFAFSSSAIKRLFHIHMVLNSH